MSARFKALLLLMLMLFAVGGAYGLKPTQKIADAAPPVDLASMIPTAFGDWKEDLLRATQIVDPLQQQMIEKIYSKTLQRTYVNSDCYHVTLSIAYGTNQSDSMQVHKPEVCYPAQGFVLHEKRSDELMTPFGALPITRVRASQGARNEPITYWTTVGDRVIESGLHKKIVEMGYGLSGRIPDGMLIRVSSIDAETNSAYEIQGHFIDQLLGAAEPQHRIRLTGNPRTH